MEVICFSPPFTYFDTAKLSCKNPPEHAQNRTLHGHIDHSVFLLYSSRLYKPGPVKRRSKELLKNKSAISPL